MLIEYHDPEVKMGMRELFDIAIDEAVTDEHFSAALEVDEETGKPMLSLLQEADDSLLELVFLCDARAQIENDDYSVIGPVSWVHFAKAGILRVAQHMPAKGDLERARLFSDSAIKAQTEAYEDMCARRDVIKGPEEADFTGIQYAVRVARGEIILDVHQDH